MVSNNQFAPMWTEHGFSQAVSVGNFCHSAQVLKEVGYRSFSGPFDWIFCNPKALCHILNDDFQTFLDQKYYQPVPVEQRIVPEANFCEHSYYRQHHGVRHMFNHHRPDQDPDYFHYQQSVNEFRQLLRSSSRVLFLMVSNYPLNNELYSEVVNALENYGFSFSFLGVEFSQSDRDISSSVGENIRVTYHDEKTLVVDFKVKALSTGNSFTHSVDNLHFRDFLRSFRVGFNPIVDF